MTTPPSRPVRFQREGLIPLFWRLFIPNATVLAAACVVLIIEPANGRIPALVDGLLLMHLDPAPGGGTAVILRLPPRGSD